jgi:hypothetical protein
MQAFEISRFGYWISPEGKILALEVPQSHAAILLREGVFPDEVFEHLSDAVERAVAVGWIGVSIAPVGTSVSVRVRDASVDIRAVRALQELVEACGWQDLILHTEHQSGTGKELVLALKKGAFDSKTYETYEGHATVLKDKLSAGYQSRSNLIALRDFLETPGTFSSREVLARLRHARTACDDALKSIKSYSFRNITKLETALTYAGDLHAGFLYQERIIDERLALAQSEFFANFELPSYADPLAPFEDCSPVLAVRELQREIEAVKKSESQVKAEIRTMEGGEQALAFLTRLLVTRSSLGLARHHMKRFADDLSQDDLTTEKVISLTQYYIAHECARTYSSNSWKPFGEMQMALAEFETAIKRQPVLGM